MLRAQFFIDPNEDRLKESARLLKLLFYIIDRLESIRLSSSSKAKTDKNRKEAEKVKAREKKDEQEEEKLKKKKEKELQF